MTLTKLLKFGTGYGGYDKEVAFVQKLLQQLGYYAGKIDGQFGSLTLQAVKNFQRDYGLVVDGIVGRNTFNKLLEVVNRNIPKPANNVNIPVQPTSNQSNNNIFLFLLLGLGAYFLLKK